MAVRTLSLATLGVVLVLLPTLFCGRRGIGLVPLVAVALLSVRRSSRRNDLVMGPTLRTRLLDVYERHCLAQATRLTLVVFALALEPVEIVGHLPDGQYEREARIRHAPCAVRLLGQLVEHERVRIVVLLRAADRLADDLQVADERLVQRDHRAAMSAQVGVGLRTLHHGLRPYERNCLILGRHSNFSLVKPTMR